MVNTSIVWVLIATAGLTTGLLPQAASSPSWFLAASTVSQAERAASTNFALTGGFTAMPVGRASSAGVSITAGFGAAVPVSPQTEPWLTAVSPRFATMHSSAPVAVVGANLDLGGTASLTIGGQPAVIGARTAARIDTVLPFQPIPGWHAVELKTSLGTTTSSHAIGILPLIELKQPSPVGAQIDFVYRGRPGDQVLLILSLNMLPVTVPILTFGHGLQLDLNAGFAVSIGSPSVNDGVLILPLPMKPAIPIFAQVLTLSFDPGYAPGSFTNTITL